MKRQRGFKRQPKKFFYKEDIFLSRMASVLKLPQSKVKELFYQHTLCAIKLTGIGKEELERKSLKLKNVLWSSNTYLVTNENPNTLKKTPEYNQGLFYIFNLAEIIPIFALNPKSDEKVLDIYPNQSILEIAELMENTGQIIANVDTENYAQEIQKGLQKYSVKNVEINLDKAEDLDKKYIESFDKILLNSPCSKEGIASFTKKRPLKNWSIQKTKIMSKLQEKLITVAFKCLKKDGLLIYSTKTISPNENEAVISNFLNKNKDAVLKNIELIEKEEFKEYKPFVKRGLKEWNNEIFHPDIVKTIRTIPGKTMLGTYVALIKKHPSY
jgi:tRNA (cytosine49-C5)-methyltransferase